MPRASLPTIPTLPVPHRKQTQASDCLAACVAMVLDYLHRPVPYARLLSLLGIGPIGAPRRNILRLTRLGGLEVIYRTATLSLVAQYLLTRDPVIAFVDTGELSYWLSTTNHALVVVGMDNEHVLVHDPAYTIFPISISHLEFELAWLNGDNTCAVIQAL